MLWPPMSLVQSMPPSWWIYSPTTLRVTLGGGEGQPRGMSDRRTQGSCSVAVSKGGVQVALCQRRHIET